MFTDFRNRLTYFGTLDDVVYRYPWPTPFDIRSIQQQLVTSAIYDKKILINDGYLITNPQLLGQLSDIDQSLVGNLMMTGAARLFARGGKSNLAAGIEKNAEKISTHARVVRDKARWRVMRDDLEFLSSEVEKYTLPWPNDKNMGAIFHSLMARVYAMGESDKLKLLPPGTAKDFDAVFERFDKEIAKPSYGQARSVWEDQCWIHFRGCVIAPEEISELSTTTARAAKFAEYQRVRVLMNVANEAYHLAYSAAACHSLQSGAPFPGIDSSTMGVTSSLITAFPDLVGPEQTAAEPDPAKIAALNQLLITIPPRLKFKDDFFFVTRLTTNGDCRRARSEYLRAIADFVDDRADHATALAARNDYVDALARQIEPGVRRWWLEYLVGRLVDVIVSPLDMALGAVGAGLLSTLLLPIGIDHLNTILVERLVQARVRTALGDEGIIATQSAVAPPLARQLGLYLGPIKSDGGSRLLKDIGPPS